MKDFFVTQKNWLTIPLLCIIAFLLVVIVIMRHYKPVGLPYTIGAPVTPQSQLPKGMVLKTFDVPQTEPVPTLAFEIVQDSMGGWDVHTMTTNFIFSPEHLNGAPVPGEGHLHLYIDNNLVIMLGPWYHIDSLTPGDHVIKVGLFNNDHSAYAVGGMQIIAEKTVHVSATSTADMQAQMQGMSGM